VGDAFQGGMSLPCWALGSRNWDKITRLYWASTFKSVHLPGKGLYFWNYMQDFTAELWWEWW